MNMDMDRDEVRRKKPDRSEVGCDAAAVSRTLQIAE
jgi:hypothetical protein